MVKPINGNLGYISNTFDKTAAGKVLRQYLSNFTCFMEYIDFTEVQIFEGATTYPVIIVLKVKEPVNNKFNYTKIPTDSQAKVIAISDVLPVEVLQGILEPDSWSFFPNPKALLYKRLGGVP